MRADVSTIREEAAERFRTLGWPTTRQEEWKYTNVAPIAKVNWRDGGPPLSTAVEGEGVRVIPIAGASEAELQPYFGRIADWQRNPFVALNVANAHDGAFVIVEPGAVATVHLTFTGGDDEVWSHPHNVIVAGRAAQLTIVETYSGKGRYFTNGVTELFAGEGAVVDHYKLECESRDAYHVGTLQVRQDRSSSVTSHNTSFGGALVRNEVGVVLAGPGASLSLDGLFVVTGTQHIDNHTLIDHLAPHCESHELYKGILDESGRGIFDGRIIVRPDAQKTVSRQENRNLLLSETAIVDSKPTLEIHNDDVKCNHGSTIGQLEEEPLFYLRSRGIGEEEARNLLVYAFASEIVDRMKVEPVREEVRRALFQQMPGRMPERREANR